MKEDNPRTIHLLCTSYLNKVVPADASTVQVKETRKAFMSGAMMMYEAIFAYMSAPEEEAMKSLDFLNEEFEAFKVEIGVVDVKKCLWYKSDHSTGCNNSYGKFNTKELSSFKNCPFCGGEIEVYDNE